MGSDIRLLDGSVGMIVVGKCLGFVKDGNMIDNNVSVVLCQSSGGDSSGNSRYPSRSSLR